MNGKHTSHWIILIILALAQFMVILDSSIVNVAIPSIERAFHLIPSTLQWIVTAYTLAFGGFLLLGGRAADLYGRRKVFLGGVTLFAIVSLADGLSRNGGMLIALRGMQGLAGAFMSPAALSIVLVTYKEGHEKYCFIGLGCCRRRRCCRRFVVGRNINPVLGLAMEFLY